jgi:hypothetical protein
MDSTYGRGGVTSNEDVLRFFCTNSTEVKANNLSTHYDSYNDEVLLRQYGTLIATRKGDKVMITAKRYSVTTSKVQNELLRLAMEYGLDVQKTTEFAKGGMSRKCEVGDNVFVKSKGLSGLVSRVNGENCYVKFAGNLSKHDGTYNMNDLKIEESSLFMDEYAKGGGVKSNRTKGKYIVNPFFYGTDDYWERRENLERFLNYTNEEIYSKWLSDEINDENAVFMVEEQNGEVFNPKMKYAKGGEVGSKANDITLTKSEINEYAKLTWAKEKIIDRMLRLNGDCIDNRQALEDQLDDIYRKTQELQNRLNEKYGGAMIKPFSFRSKSKTILNSQYAKGGDIAQGNYEMMLSQAKEVEHHVEELQNILKGEKDIDAWVVAKMENVSSTLSDITHYLDGKTEYAHGGKMSRGGYFGKDALVKDLSEEFASEELLAKFRKKSGIKDTQLTKPNVIAFAYTDYGGDFMDKVAIEYFLENHPKNIVVENTGYSGKNAIVWGKVAMDWVEATEDYAFGYEDFESYYYDKVYKEEEQAFSEYLYELQGSDTRGFSRFGSYELDYDEVLQWLLENKGGYYTIMTTGLDFNSDDLTQELLAEGLIEKSEEYAKGGKTDNILALYKKSKFSEKDEKVIDNAIENGDFDTIDIKENFMDYVYNRIDKEYKDEFETEQIWQYTDEQYENLLTHQENYKNLISYLKNKNEYAKGGNINSKTNKKMATKKSNDGQTAPQIKRWLFAGSKGGYNYYNIEKRPYKKPVDEEKKGAPVGYRFSKFAEEKGITNNRFRKPTKSEVEQYAGKKKNGKLIMYRETRSNKSDVNPKKKI